MDLGMLFTNLKKVGSGATCTNPMAKFQYQCKFYKSINIYAKSGGMNTSL